VVKVLDLLAQATFEFVEEPIYLGQLEAAFQRMAGRGDPVEGLHHGMNALVTNATFGLTRDFPDPVRQSGEERF